MENEDKKKRLEEAGYSVGRQASGGNSAYECAYVGSPDGWEYMGKDYMITRTNSEEIRMRCEAEALEYAWKHYQDAKLLKELRQKAQEYLDSKSLDKRDRLTDDIIVALIADSI